MLTQGSPKTPFDAATVHVVSPSQAAVTIDSEFEAIQLRSFMES